MSLRVRFVFILFICVPAVSFVYVRGVAVSARKASTQPHDFYIWEDITGPYTAIDQVRTLNVLRRVRHCDGGLSH